MKQKTRVIDVGCFKTDVFYFRFSLQSRRGGLVKVYDSALMSGVSFWILLHVYKGRRTKNNHLGIFFTVKVQKSADFRENDSWRTYSDAAELLQFKRTSWAILIVRSLWGRGISEKIASWRFAFGGDAEVDEYR